ncbi:MAG: protein-methionine-sulfoxide reductase catalytic subunit MsrP [Gammaproteobacteria bacterium]|nr:protein-methionine-sulfoxide reductase catalytic subunit MsrP [Gammaproteobacteria bacterium]MCP5137903.1 protein-methionine-sulfoxide reductase catalytic subunit MsrP [Gammaproteobacteria bacterium]
MLIKKPDYIRESEVTDREVYLQRREFLRKAGAVTAAGVAVTAGVASQAAWWFSSDKTESPSPVPRGESLGTLIKSPYSTDEPQTPYDDITSYCNFYELGTSKSDPKDNAHFLKPKPWSVAIEGECARPGVYDLEDILKPHPLEERIYRLRCVETWSAVVPWVGFPLADLIKRFEPSSRAKYVEFVTLKDPKQMPGQRFPVLNWPYVEGLRMDEAVNPLTLLAVGLYGEVLPNQNGAPIRLVVPWKYGFKSIKSIVSIRFTEKQPLNTWQDQAAREYGFYANVNPDVDHPRWSQAKERRLGDLLKRPTLPFNGYAEQVAHLYTGMDPKKLY